MNDVFISYARSDSGWVEEEFLPALEEIGAIYFLDDAEWRKQREMIEANGLLPGDDIAEKLAAALKSSRVIALIHSPAYFASKWCRSELDVAEKLAAESGESGEGVKLLYFILSRHEKRLDLSPAGDRVLYVDLTNVQERAEKLRYGLQRVKAAAAKCAFKLGQRSLQHLLEEPAVKEQVEALRSCHRQFREAHDRMQAYKAVHDTLQRAQDAWREVDSVRGDIKGGKPTSPLMVVTDLATRCDDVKAAIEAPLLQGEWKMWQGLLKSCLTQLAEMRAALRKGGPINLDGLNGVLELTSGLLFGSPIAAQMNEKIHGAFKLLPVKLLREAVAPLRVLEKFPWQDTPRARLTTLLAEFDELEKLLAGIDDLVEVHDILQNIDSVFSVAIRVETKLLTIEAIWPGIEMERQKLQPRMLEATWLENFADAATSMNNYLQQDPKPLVVPRVEIEFFQKQLDHSFTRADVDLLHGTTRLQQRHHTIDELLTQLANAIKQ